MIPLEVSPKTVACPGHGDHLRACWPAGFTAFGMAMVQATLASEAFICEVDPTWDGTDGAATLDVEAANAVLARKPCCYFVDRDAIRSALADSGIATIATCGLCQRSGLGGPYTVATPKRTTLPHVCIECALDIGERIHRDKPNGEVW